MTYGFRPEHWPTFEAELERRSIIVAEIERMELRSEKLPENAPESVSKNTPPSVIVTLTLRSGRVESWSQSGNPVE